MAQRYPSKGSYAAFLSLSALLFVLIMLFVWFWLRERKPAPVHTQTPQSSELWQACPAPYLRSKIRAKAPLPA